MPTNLLKPLSAGVLLAGLPIAMGCADLSGEPGDDLGRATQAFQSLDALSSYLTAHVQRGSTIRMCVTGTGVTSANRASHEADIREAVSEWVSAMAPVSKVALISGDAVTFTCNTPDYTVEYFDQAGRANATYQRIHMFRSDGYETLLHEFGHAFGLADTYIEDVWSCEGDQPDSLMCSGRGTLQPDDILGIQEVYCTVFNTDCKRRWERDMRWCGHDNGRVYTGDFNGDGHTDMLCHDVADGRKWTSLASATGTFSGDSWSASLNWCKGANTRLYIGDFNGDKRDDMLCHNVVTGARAVSLASTSGTFSGTSWYDNDAFCDGPNGQLLIGKFNADTRDDMMCHSVVTGRKWVALASSTGGFPQTDWVSQDNWCGYENGRLFVGDFNGDKRDDILCHDVADGRKWVIYATASGTFPSDSWSARMAWCAEEGRELRVGDFSGDGRADLLCHDTVTGNKWFAFAHETGELFTGTSRALSMSWCKASKGELLFGDFDHSNTTDFLCHQPGTGYKWIAYNQPRTE